MSDRSREALSASIAHLIVVALITALAVTCIGMVWLARVGLLG
ncbi:MAG: hypothetical protein JWN03_7391 [Nocardia sp.]|nr:hypothetical protein [Nocardia sp.]MCU1647116.1 hypothetical protein [Nocardia sp.]